MEVLHYKADRTPIRNFVQVTIIKPATSNLALHAPRRATPGRGFSSARQWPAPTSACHHLARPPPPQPPPSRPPPLPPTTRHHPANSSASRPHSVLHAQRPRRGSCRGSCRRCRCRCRYHGRGRGRGVGHQLRVRDPADTGGRTLRPYLGAQWDPTARGRPQATLLHECRDCIIYLCGRTISDAGRRPVEHCHRRCTLSIPESL